MFTSSDLPPAQGWIFTGDPGPFPPVDVALAADCSCDPATGGAGAADLGAVQPDLSGWAVPGVSRPVAGPHRLLVGLTAAVDALAEHGAVSGSRVDTGALLQLAERVRALGLRELAEMDATGGHQLAGARPTTAAWLRDSRLLTDSAARAAVRLAVELRDDLPELAGLLAAGRVGVEHAGAVSAGVRGLDRELIRQAGGGLAAFALTCDPVELRRRLRDKATAIDDRLAADVDRRARDRQHLRLAQVGGHTAVDGTLAGEDGATVRLAMALAVEAARADGDLRSPTARQAGVFVAWAVDYLQRRSAGDSLAGDAHTVRTHLLMVCTPEQLTSTSRADQGDQADQADQADQGEQGAGDAPTLVELLERDVAGAGPVSPTIVGTSSPLSRAALRRLACDATLTLAVLRSPDAATCPAGCPPQLGRVCEHLTTPLYVGRSARTISSQQFKALVIRDRRCVVRGCHRPPAQCAGHHVQHWADGGATDLNNLVLLCHQHHHDLHDRGHDLPHHDGQRWLTATGWGRAPT